MSSVNCFCSFSDSFFNPNSWYVSISFFDWLLCCNMVTALEYFHAFRMLFQMAFERSYIFTSLHPIKKLVLQVSHVVAFLSAMEALMQISSGIGFDSSASDSVGQWPHSSPAPCWFGISSSFWPPQHFLQPAALPTSILLSISGQYLQSSCASCSQLHLTL